MSNQCLRAYLSLSMIFEKAEKYKESVSPHKTPLLIGPFMHPLLVEWQREGKGLLLWMVAN